VWEPFTTHRLFLLSPFPLFRTCFVAHTPPPATCPFPYLPSPFTPSSVPIFLLSPTIHFKLAFSSLSLHIYVQGHARVNGATEGLQRQQEVCARSSLCFQKLRFPPHTCTYTYMHTYTHACARTYIHTCAHIHTCMHARMHACMQAYIHTCIHAYIHTYTHTYMHTFLGSYFNTQNRTLLLFNRTGQGRVPRRFSATMNSGAKNGLVCLTKILISAWK
jgi:hypothetical protein